MTTMNEPETKSTSSIPISLKGQDESGKPVPTRDQFYKGTNLPMTQLLFLEPKYEPEYALYTTKDIDHIFEGVLFPSIKRLYLEMEDVTEYEFANKYFLGWDHWQRVVANKIFTEQVESWREELELKLTARTVSEMRKLAKEGSFQASKWLMDQGWQPKRAGRPSKEDVDSELKRRADVQDEYGSDAARLGIK